MGVVDALIKVWPAAGGARGTNGQKERKKEERQKNDRERRGYCKGHVIG